MAELLNKEMEVGFNPRPREEATQHHDKSEQGNHVSIHAPVRRRPLLFLEKCVRCLFQSTPP